MPGKCVLRYSRTKKRLSKLKKPRSSKSPKIEIFRKALTHGFGEKEIPFFNFVLGNIGQENVFYDILEPKTVLLGYKNKFKSQKIEIFPKGLTHGFGSKMAFFFQLFFRQFRPGKCVLRYSRTKKRLSRI